MSSPATGGMAIGGAGYAYNPDNQAMNRETMTSDQAENARQKSAAVMEALRSGESGAADKAMGQSAGTGGASLGTLARLKNKLGKRRPTTAADGKGLDDDDSVVR